MIVVNSTKAAATFPCFLRKVYFRVKASPFTAVAREGCRQACLIGLQKRVTAALQKSLPAHMPSNVPRAKQVRNVIVKG